MKSAVSVASAALLASSFAGCGGKSEAVVHPLVASAGVEAGPSSRLWGDGACTPTGMHLGCIRRRHFALVVTLRNPRNPVTLVRARADQPWAEIGIIPRVAVQFRLAPPPPTGDLLVVGLRRWSRSTPTPVMIPPGRSAWVQANFMMNNCSLLPPHAALTANRAITVTYRSNGHEGSQQIAVLDARIILRR